MAQCIIVGVCANVCACAKGDLQRLYGHCREGDGCLCVFVCADIPAGVSPIVLCRRGCS